MRLKIFVAIAVRILIVGLIGMFMSYIPENLRDFFGDVPAKKDPFPAILDDGYDWGVRHYWYFWTTTALFFLAIVSVVISIRKIIERESF